MSISNKLQEKIIKLAIAGYDLPNANKRHFSFIVNKNKVISYGWNNGWKSHPLAFRYKHRFSNIHSELAAIRNFPYPPRFLADYKLINVRLLADKSLGYSFPCCYCLKLLSDLGLQRVYYTNRAGLIVEL